MKKTSYTYFDPIDIHFGRLMVRMAKSADAVSKNGSYDSDNEIFLAAALASHAVGKGHVCLDLNARAGDAFFQDLKEPDALLLPEPSAWITALQKATVVGAPGEERPLILDNKGRLYLYRFWAYERALSETILQRVRRIEAFTDQILPPYLEKALDRLFPGPDKNGHDLQKVAARTAALKRFCVVSGGPGTGKTHTISKILAFLLQQQTSGKMRIALAAPTGKAAARLAESIQSAMAGIDCPEDIKAQIPTEAYTLHRLLKRIPDSPYFRHNAQNPLPADVVVVDEASMVDLALMSKLMQAVRADARVILVGDKDQLASVAAGSVLGDICYHTRQADVKAAKINGPKRESLDRPYKECDGKSALKQAIVLLKKNYRFASDSRINGLSRAINRGDVKEVQAFLQNAPQRDVGWQQTGSPAHFYKALKPYIINGYDAVFKTRDPRQALMRLQGFQILCAVKAGPYGVIALNRFAEAVLKKEGFISEQGPWYAGRPVLITQNDYHLGLFNGDVGITLPDVRSDTRSLYVYFAGQDGALRRFLPHRLQQAQTAYAMTVHKSQGSEFETVMLVLPDTDYAVLTRELIYTGITRARKQVVLWANQDIIKNAVLRKIERSSGLRDALWQGKKTLD